MITGRDGNQPRVIIVYFRQALSYCGDVKAFAMVATGWQAVNHLMKP